MSSAMMTRMFGFCGCCAMAGAHAAVAATADKASSAGRMLFAKLITHSSGFFSASDASPIPWALLLEVLRSDSKEDRRPVISCPEMAGSFGAGRSRFRCRRAPHFRSFALIAGLLQSLQDAVEVVGLRRLHRRELLVRHQLLFPE